MDSHKAYISSQYDNSCGWSFTNHSHKLVLFSPAFTYTLWKKSIPLILCTCCLANPIVYPTARNKRSIWQLTLNVRYKGAVGLWDRGGGGKWIVPGRQFLGCWGQETLNGCSQISLILRCLDLSTLQCCVYKAGALDAAVLLIVCGLHNF